MRSAKPRSDNFDVELELFQEGLPDLPGPILSPQIPFLFKQALRVRRCDACPFQTAFSRITARDQATNHSAHQTA